MCLRALQKTKSGFRMERCLECSSPWSRPFSSPFPPERSAVRRSPVTKLLRTRLGSHSRPGWERSERVGTAAGSGRRPPRPRQDPFRAGAASLSAPEAATLRGAQMRRAPGVTPIPHCFLGKYCRGTSGSVARSVHFPGPSNREIEAGSSFDELFYPKMKDDFAAMSGK